MRSKVFVRVTIIICWSFLWFGQSGCVEFDQNYFGVLFSPYVKKFSGPIHTAETITCSDIKTMLNVTSQKFSKLLISGPRGSARQDYYFHNITNYLGNYVSVYAGEIAAIMNKEDDSRKISIMYQLERFDTVQQLRWDISLALQAAEKANDIFPGTVEGISLYQHEDLQGILNHLNTHRIQASALGIKLGAMQDCQQLLQKENDTWNNIGREIVQAADFIICRLEPSSPSLGPVNTWPSIGEAFMSFKRIIGQINSSVEVIGYTMWSSCGLEKWESVENLRTYWAMASKWSVENQYRIYLAEAFDNPNRHKPGYQHLGWWRHDSNSEIDSVNGYVEKISVNGDKSGNEDSFKGRSERILILLTTATAGVVWGILFTVLTFIVILPLLRRRTVT